MAYGSGRPAPLGERIQRHITKDGDCWLWTGTKRPNGYGHINAGRGRYIPAHRASYEAFVGPIPEGLHIDHLCGKPLCVNPAHLEAVTARENVMRGRAPMIAVHLSRKCSRGHDASESYIRKGTTRVVYCRACRKEDRAIERAARLESSKPRICRQCRGSIAPTSRSDALYCSAKCRSDFRHGSGVATRRN